MRDKLRCVVCGYYQIPASKLNALQFILLDDSPDASGNVAAVLEREIQFNFIDDLPVQVYHATQGLVRKLKEVMARAERKDRVEGGDSASTS